jgi:hypothetical protein
MPSEAYQRFIDSMAMDFDKWHDGTGYDLKALGQLGPEEGEAIERLLIENLRQGGDWRDVEALTALGTTAARAAVDHARFHRNTKVRHYALRTVLANRTSKDTPEAELTELEDQVVQAVAHGNYEMAQHMPTLRVKQALLDSVREGDSVTRVNAAAFLLYLCDQASEPFDWSQRPFFLQFGKRNPKLRASAWEHLRKRVGL